jgi:hypothetical protein
MHSLKLYDYAASANCYKVRLLLAQLGRLYERIPIEIFDGDTLTDQSAERNPARATPVLEIGDGLLLPESNAILLYLGRGTEFLPDDSFELAQVVPWRADGRDDDGGWSALPAPHRTLHSRRSGCDSSVQAWLSRVEEQPAYMNDLEPYPDNAGPGAGVSIYG